MTPRAAMLMLMVFVILIVLAYQLPNYQGIQ